MLFSHLFLFLGHSVFLKWSQIKHSLKEKINEKCKCCFSFIGKKSFFFYSTFSLKSVKLFILFKNQVKEEKTFWCYSNLVESKWHYLIPPPNICQSFYLSILPVPVSGLVYFNGRLLGNVGLLYRRNTNRVTLNTFKSKRCDGVNNYISSSTFLFVQSYVFYILKLFSIIS